MIVRMNKYTLVLYHQCRQEFLDRLQELGLVDVTTTGWEASEKDRVLLSSIDRHRQAVSRLKEMASAADFQPTAPYTNGREAFEAYQKASSSMESLSAQKVRIQKELAELEILGDFRADAVSELRERGVALNLFSCYTSDFEAHLQDWSEQYIVEKISEVGNTTYFAVITSSADQTVAVDAQPLRMPDADAAQKHTELRNVETGLESTAAVMRRCASSIDRIEKDGEKLAERLQLSQVSASGETALDGALTVLEGWGPKEDEAAIDAFLDSSEGVYYIKERPTPEDDTPVLLRNGAFARPFEFIGSLYSLPKYGSLDLTRFFGPFYMLFFGICLGDAGYGLLLLLGGLYMLLKMPKMREIAKLTMYCGGATVVCGFIVGSFFGIQLPGLEMFRNYRDMFLTTDKLFYVALALGGVQLVFAMVLNIYSITVQHGFKYSLENLGWLLLIVGSALAALLPESFGFTFHSLAYKLLVVVCAVLMLFLNNPNRNPIANFGSGLWDLYNNVVGILGDILSYIRLFALCLSGGTLALVFNDLAVGMAPDIPVVRQLFVIVILIFGHGINLFMSAIGSFVHPMRLTFVEFYKNSGFEATMRSFNPFRKAAD